MAKLRATESYVFTSDDLVGKGATCEVYKGINKVSFVYTLIIDHEKMTCQIYK